MGDIVATIQQEQDLAIRAAINKVLIVTGGPEQVKLLLRYTAQHICFIHIETR